MADESQLTAENFKGEDMMLDIESLILHPDLQQRALADDFEKKEYKSATHDVAESIKDKETIEPILVINIPEGTKKVLDGKEVKPGYYVAEGNRRVAGYKEAGRAKIPAKVRVGTWEDAVDVSTSANIKNLALPRKPGDKRRAVVSCLINHFEWSDRRIAEHVHVGGELVAKCRPEAEKFLKTFAKDQPNGKPLDTKTRVGKGGKRQAATKKTAKKAKKVIDWSGYEGPYGSLVRFVDHVGEMTLTEEDRKKQGTDYQKAHQILKALGSRLKAWAAKKPKFVV